METETAEKLDRSLAVTALYRLLRAAMERSSP